MKLCIAVPFENASRNVPIWAKDENKIDFRSDDKLAVRCTLSFAAMEIKEHLSLFFPDIDVYFSESRTKDMCIKFAMVKNSKSDSFILSPIENGVEIIGSGRTGALYGAYEILKEQGIRWVSPYIAPKRVKNDDFSLPSERKEYIPSMPLGRGFLFAGAQKESTKLFLWMARNNLNMGAHRANCGALQDKLGMLYRVGGHIFEPLLAPDRTLPSGKTIWEEHSEWYGKPKSGNITKDKALSNQFCVSQDSLLDFLAEEVIEGLTNGVWQNTDQLEIAGFDTWGNACNCEECNKLGNATDKHLHFISHIRTKLDEAYKNGRINRKVNLALEIYEGTCTLYPPEKEIPENIKTSGDYIIHYPIRRCYKHTIDDPDCSYNDFYYQTMKKWPDIPAMVGEYYNVSKFEDLPLLFTKTIPHDLRTYKNIGIQGMTYMHFPLIAWGVRALTQLLYAKFSWDSETNEEQFISEYFICKYGKYADEIKHAYELNEEAWELSSSWRAWCGGSILSNLMCWDGKKPSSMLYNDDHFDDDMNIRGFESVKKMNEALEIFKDVREKDSAEFLETHEFKITVPKNPTEVCFGDATPPLFDVLSEDIRGIEYGIDTMSLMAEFCEYYILLYNNQNADSCWERIEKLAQKLNSYYVPLTLNSRETEIYCHDAFTRTQLKALYFRAKKARIENK